MTRSGSPARRLVYVLAASVVVCLRTIPHARTHTHTHCVCVCACVRGGSYVHTHTAAHTHRFTRLFHVQRGRTGIRFCWSMRNDNSTNIIIEVVAFNCSVYHTPFSFLLTFCCVCSTGWRAFSVAAPSVWNSLADYLRDPPVLGSKSFRRQLDILVCIQVQRIERIRDITTMRCIYLLVSYLVYLL